MSATSLAVRPIPSHLEPHVGRPPCSVSDLIIATRVHADRRRLFQALTLPEYMEAWIALTGDSDMRLAVSSNSESFSIDIADANRPGPSITGVYLMRRRSKLIFTWKNGWSPDGAMCVVTIRLRGDFDRSELVLVHAGLKTWREFEWHLRFWQESIRRLSNLFLSPKRIAKNIIMGGLRAEGPVYMVKSWGIREQTGARGASPLG